MRIAQNQGYFSVLRQNNLTLTAPIKTLLLVSLLLLSSCFDDPIASDDSSSSNTSSMDDSLNTVHWSEKPSHVLTHDSTWGQPIPRDSLPEVCKNLEDSASQKSPLYTNDTYSFYWTTSRVFSLENFGREESDSYVRECCDSLGADFDSYTLPVSWDYQQECNFPADDAGQNCNEDSGCRFGCNLESALNKCDTLGSVNYNHDSTHVSYKLKCPTLTPGACRWYPSENPWSETLGLELEQTYDIIYVEYSTNVVY